MTSGVVLMLAGLAAGDAETGAAAVAPVEVNPFACELEGTWQNQWGDVGRVRLARGVMETDLYGAWMTCPCVLSDEGQGRVRVSWRGDTYPGIYKREGGRLVLCVPVKPGGDRPVSFQAGPQVDRLILRPAGPRRP